MFQYLASGQPAAEGVDNSHQGAPGWAGERLERQVQGEKSSHHGSRLRKILAVKFSTLFPYLHSAWLTCDHSCILKRTCLYLCIPIVFIIVIVFLYAWCCRGKDGECPKSPEHVLCQVQQTRKVQGGRHLDDLAPLTMSPWWFCSFDNVTSFSIQVTQYKKSAESKQAQGRRRWIIFSILLSSLENIISSIDQNPRSQNFLQYRRVSIIELGMEV